jgi:hypothetical protein
MSLDIAIAAAQVVAGTVVVPGSFNQRTTQEIKVVIPTYANAVTFTFSILDKEGHTRYSISGLDKPTQTILLVARLIKPGYTLSMLMSGATGTDITISIYPDYESPI